MANPGTGTEWLIIRNVVSTSPFVTAYTDESHRLHFGDGAGGLGGSEMSSFGAMLKQRATANIAINVPVGDTYQPEVGWQIYLYDIKDGVQTPVFSGQISNVEWSWWGREGNRLAALSCVSFEYVFDSIRVPGGLYTGRTAGFIFNDLLQLAAGWPGSTGDIADGLTIPTFLVEGLPTISELFDKLAVIAQYVWAVDPVTLKINFNYPAAYPSPFTLADADVLWEQASYKQDLHDFRDRQYITLDYTAFGNSSELFVGDGVSTNFLLRNPVHDVTDAWITRNTQNTATGIMGGQPTPGDTVSIGYPTSGSAYNWAPNSPYQVGYVIIDPANHSQRVIAVSGISRSGSSYGNSGNTEPAWNDTGSTTDDGGLTWQDDGELGFGPNLAAIYTFVTTLDNTKFGEVLIDLTSNLTLRNLINAINSDTATRGGLYSLPTWENQICDADSAAGGSTFTIRNKGAGRSNVASLSTTSSAFSWSAPLTSGGITTFDTVSLSVGINQPGQRSTSLSYNPGSAVVTLASPLNTGTNLEVGYHRIDGNAIAVENTPLVAERHLIDGSTGKYQALTSDVVSGGPSRTPVQALADANSALRGFETIPDTFEFETLRPGLNVNQGLTVTFQRPYGPDTTKGYQGNWRNRRSITVINLTDPLSNFPIEIIGTYGYLRNVGYGGEVFSQFGYDIMFTTDILGEHTMNWEIQSYDPATGSVIFWVEGIIGNGASQPQLIFYMWYGNPTIDTFQSNDIPWNFPEMSDNNTLEHWAGVYHLKENSPPYKDSSAFANDLTGGASPTLLPTGGPANGPSQSFSAITEQTLSAPNPILGVHYSGFSLWIKTTAGAIGVCSWGKNDNGIELYIDASGYATIFDDQYNVSVQVTTPINDGNWHYVACWRAALSGTLFPRLSILVDGATVWTSLNITSMALPGTPIVLGGLGPTFTGTSYFTGEIAEFRLLTDDSLLHFYLAFWFGQGEFLNQGDPATFYAIGPAIVFGPAWIIQEVRGELIPTPTQLATFGGHFRYHVTCIDQAQYGSYLEFWEGLGGGGGGGAITSVAAFNTPPAAPPAPPTFSDGFAKTFSVPGPGSAIVTVNHNLGTVNVIVQVWDAGSPSMQIQPEIMTVISPNAIQMTMEPPIRGAGGLIIIKAVVLP